MFTGKIIALAVALMLTLAGAVGYFIMKMRADDAVEREKWARDTRSRWTPILRPGEKRRNGQP